MHAVGPRDRREVLEQQRCDTTTLMFIRDDEGDLGDPHCHHVVTSGGHDVVAEQRNQRHVGDAVGVAHLERRRVRSGDTDEKNRKYRDSALRRANILPSAGSSAVRISRTCNVAPSARTTSASHASGARVTAWRFVAAARRLEPGREHRGLGAALHSELREQVRDVVLDGLLGEEHALADLAVREPLGDEIEDLALLLGQAREAFVFRGSVAQPLEHTRSDVRVEQRLPGRDACGSRRRDRCP